MTSQQQKNRAIPLFDSLDDRVMLSAASTIGTPAAAAVEIARSIIPNDRLIHRIDAIIHGRQGRFHEPKAGHTHLQNAVVPIIHRIFANRPPLPQQSRNAQSGIGTLGTSAGTSPYALGTTTFTQPSAGFAAIGFNPNWSVVTGSSGAGVYPGVDVFGITSGSGTGIALTDYADSVCC
jgi:hypothetical protein